MIFNLTKARQIARKNNANMEKLEENTNVDDKHLAKNAIRLREKIGAKN